VQICFPGSLNCGEVALVRGNEPCCCACLVEDRILVVCGEGLGTAGKDPKHLETTGAAETNQDRRSKPVQPGTGRPGARTDDSALPGSSAGPVVFPLPRRVSCH